ncbi:hypothetical protein [Silvibacterium sp.]|uniref:hypothetical protein n=1 Tax=Silvibacterium sp. TaxID=1964179 RepID=UPI0039E5F67C
MMANRHNSTPALIFLETGSIPTCAPVSTLHRRTRDSGVLTSGEQLLELCQQARRIADRLVGPNQNPQLWDATYRSTRDEIIAFHCKSETVGGAAWKH